MNECIDKGQFKIFLNNIKKEEKFVAFTKRLSLVSKSVCKAEFNDKYFNYIINISYFYN